MHSIFQCIFCYFLSEIPIILTRLITPSFSTAATLPGKLAGLGEAPALFRFRPAATLTHAPVSFEKY